jgi:hypothetical protein
MVLVLHEEINNHRNSGSFEIGPFHFVGIQEDNPLIILCDRYIKGIYIIPTACHGNQVSYFFFYSFTQSINQGSEYVDEERE